MNAVLTLGLCVFMLIWAAPAWTEPVKHQTVTQQKSQAGTDLTLSIDKTSVGIAERLRYQLLVEADAGLSADFDGIGDRFGSFQVVDRNAFGPIAMPGNRLRWQREYVLVPDDVGTAVIPSIEVALLPSKLACVSADDCELSAHGRRNANQQPLRPAIVLSTDPVDVLVDTVLPPDADLTRPRDVLAPFSVETVQTGAGGGRGWGWMLAGLAAAIAIVFGFVRHRSSEPVGENTLAAAADPAARALHALADLAGEGLPGQGRHDEHCTRLNTILRAYLLEGFRIAALELTTDELGRALNRHERLQWQQADIKRLLAQADLARFGHQYPTPDQSVEMVGQAQTIVRATATGPRQ